MGWRSLRCGKTNARLVRASILDSSGHESHRFADLASWAEKNRVYKAVAAFFRPAMGQGIPWGRGFSYGDTRTPNREESMTTEMDQNNTHRLHLTRAEFDS